MISKKTHVTVGEVANELGVSERHIYRLLREGHLKAIAISSSGKCAPQSIRVSVASINGFVEARTIDPELFFDEID
jgi:excisionase family DNA binding protein